MDLLSIMKNGRAVTPTNNGHRSNPNDVSIKFSEQYKRGKVIFRNDTDKHFPGEEVVPITIANRVYFADPKSVNKTGFKLSSSNKAAHTRFIQCSLSSFPNIRHFVGDYKTLKFDNECKLHYIERPKEF